MKATFYLLTIIFFSICFVACEKDNLDIAPNATFGGEIRDMETGELVYNRQIKKFPTEKQNVSLKHILT